MSIGKRFSQVYLKQDTPIVDSQRMRNRLSAFYWDLLNKDSSDLVKAIHMETGAKIPFLGTSFSLPQFFETCEIRDLLDSITIIFGYYKNGRINNYKAPQWHNFVSRVFREENLGYRLDELGGVHFFHDEEFERNRVATISGLSAYPSVRNAFEKAHLFLDQDTPDTASAVRAAFESIEILYKHLINAGAKERLNSHGVKNILKPKVQKKLANQPVELKATEHMLDGFCDWIDAGHMYRHGQKTDVTETPTIDFTVMFLSQGAGYLRFLLQFA